MLDYIMIMIKSFAIDILISCIFRFYGVNSSVSSKQSICDLSHINLFMGTGGPGYGDGSLSPAAQYPFGVFRLGPDTASSRADIEFRHYSGYHYLDDKIRAFSHNRLNGAGVPDLGVLGVMPIAFNPINVNWSINHDVWWSQFRKETEIATPGSYSVMLDGPNVQADMIAISNLAGIHRYEWKGDQQTRGLIIDACHSAAYDHKREDCMNATFAIDPNDPNTFRASIFKDGSLSDPTWYYLFGRIRSSVKTKQFSTHWHVCTDGPLHQPCSVLESSATSTTGTLLMAATLPPTIPTAEIQISLSYLSIEQAELNLNEAINEHVSTDFDRLAEQVQSIWCDILGGSLEVNPLGAGTVYEDTDVVTMMHSANYRLMTSLSDYTESGGLYRGVDQQIHNVTEERSSYPYVVPRKSKTSKVQSATYQYRYLSDFSLWDTFRTQLPWILLTNEDVAVAAARSLGEITLQQGSFPRWVLGSHEAGCMIGESGTSFIVECADAGLANEFDLKGIQSAYLKQSTENVPQNGRADLTHYMSEGYVSQDVYDDASSLTLTYAFDDYLLGRMSNLVQDTTNADAAFKRSKNYVNIWDSAQSLFCPKYASGEISCPKSPTAIPGWNNYVEGDALHWRWFVPHDPEGLIALFPSPDDFDAALSEFFEEHVKYQQLYGSFLPNPYYWAGNEHSALVPWLFTFGPDCTKTQYWTRNITHMHFSSNPNGLPGNDDYGAMNSWVFFASLGLFPRAGTSEFIIGSPRVQSAKVRMNHWNRESTFLEVATHNNSATNVYVKKVLVDGEEWKTSFLPRDILTKDKGVKFDFFMHAEKKSNLCSMH